MIQNTTISIIGRYLIVLLRRKRMFNSPQMREVPKGCITIDAQPCGLESLGKSYTSLQTHATKKVRVLNPLLLRLTGRKGK